MSSFLKENWLWIVLPIVLAFAVLIFFVYYFGGDEMPNFQYNI